MCCPVARSIAIHCDEPDDTPICWCCEEVVESEEDLTEVKTRDCGYQFIGKCCIEDFVI